MFTFESSLGIEVLDDDNIFERAKNEQSSQISMLTLSLLVQLKPSRNRLYRTRQEAIADVREYVAVYYKSRRLHSTLGHTTQLDYKRILIECPESVDHYKQIIDTDVS